jgi:hypothetical protein
MRLSHEKKVALTSVAYAVALVTVASLVTTHDNMTKASALPAVQAVPMTSATAMTLTNTASLRTVMLHKDNILDKFRGYKQQLTAHQLVDLLAAVGFKGNNLKVAYAIAMRESNGHPMSHNMNRRTGDNSYGLFQINMLDTMGQNRRDKFIMATNNDLYDPVRNAEAAYFMSGGTDFGAWGIGKNAYRERGTSITKWLKMYPGPGPY